MVNAVISTTMEVKKALITAAADDQRTLPLQTLVDRDGKTRTALSILIEEVLSAGIESIGVVINPDDQAAYRSAAGEYAQRVEFIGQEQSLGYAHAIHSAADFTHDEPFLLLVGDHLYISGLDRSCAQQLVQIARRRTVPYQPSRPRTKASCRSTVLSAAIS